MFARELNAKQQEAVKAVEGPLLVVAGPGSGKTRVLTYRIAHLITIGVPAYQILALTFTNKSAGEMKERIIQLVGEKSRQLWMGTFHSLFARVLRMECEHLGFHKNFSIYDTADSLALIKHILRALNIPTQQYDPQAIRSRISSAKNQFKDVEEVERGARDIFEEKTARVYAEYQRLLKQNNAMDFDDLLLKPIELFRQRKDRLAKYQDTFRFILVDEYQDTNKAQYVLINQLASKYRNICVVGDDAQSIYAFRGADIRNILDFQQDYPELKTIRLEQNYRSTRTILSAADRMIKRNVNQIAKDLWTDNQAGEPISILQCEDDKDEGKSIVARILEESRSKKFDFKDFAIMYRTNAQSRSIEDAFRRNSIPYVIVGGIEFYERKEVKDVLAYLRLIANPNDNESFLRIVNVPGRGLGNVAIERLEDFANTHQISFLEALLRIKEISGLQPKAQQAFQFFSGLVGKYAQLKSEISASELSRSLVDEIGILSLLKEEGTVESMARWENIQELLSAISEFSADREDATLESFLQDVALVSDVDRWDDTHNAVTLMTLHSAKGLEFPVVCIAGMEEGLLPFYNSSLDEKEIEEERRLCYVGITRAMKKLYLSYARVRFRFGEMSYQSPSRFLDEIPSEFVEITGSSRHFRETASIPRHRVQHKHDNDEHYYSDPMPDYDQVNQEGLRVGRMVEHEDFGRGKIVNLSGSGELAKAVVDFPDVGRKSLLLKYARLKVV